MTLLTSVRRYLQKQDWVERFMEMSKTKNLSSWSSARHHLIPRGRKDQTFTYKNIGKMVSSLVIILIAILSPGILTVKARPTLSAYSFPILQSRFGNWEIHGEAVRLVIFDPILRYYARFSGWQWWDDGAIQIQNKIGHRQGNYPTNKWRVGFNQNET